MTCDATILRAELTRWLGAAVDLSGPPVRLTGGRSADSYRIDIRDPPNGIPATLVLRLQHDDDGAAHECALQASVAKTGFPTPAVLAAGAKGNGFGRPYIIMTFMPGMDPIKAGKIRSIPTLLADTMRRLHSLDPAPVRTALAAAGVTRNARPRDVLDALTVSADSAVAAAARWLAPRMTEDDPQVVCHGDLHGLNLLMDGNRLSAVLDWELATLARREHDVARTELLLALMPGVGPAAIRPVLRWLGARAARQFLRAYRARAALDPAALDVFRALHVLRLIALARTPGSTPTGVYNLWRPLEPALLRRWRHLTRQTLE